MKEDVKDELAYVYTIGDLVFSNSKTRAKNNTSLLF
jgi:hypothetical protein